MTPAVFTALGEAPVAPLGSGSSVGGDEGDAQNTGLLTPPIWQWATIWPPLPTLVATHDVAPAGLSRTRHPSVAVQTAASLPAPIHPDSLMPQGPGSVP